MDSIEMKRDYVAKKYSEKWVNRLPDYQVAAIYQSLISRPAPKRKVDDGVQLRMDLYYEGGREYDRFG